MANTLLNALTRNLAAAEQLGDDDRAKRLKSRISKEEGAERKAAEKAEPAVAKKTTAKKAKA